MLTTTSAIGLKSDSHGSLFGCLGGGVWRSRDRHGGLVAESLAILIESHIREKVTL
jgi:hypothetical protein